MNPSEYAHALSVYRNRASMIFEAKANRRPLARQAARIVIWGPPGQRVSLRTAMTRLGSLKELAFAHGVDREWRYYLYQPESRNGPQPPTPWLN